MARARRKKSLEPALYDDDNGVEEDVEEPEGALATQTHQVVTRYVTQVPVAEIESRNLPDDDDDDAGDEVPTKPEQPSQSDPIEQFLADMGGTNARWEMVVYRLPRYATDGRADVAARERCGRLDFTEEWEAEVQKRWARASKQNHFQIVVKKNGQFFKQLPVFTCEPPLPEDMIQSAQQPIMQPALHLPYFEASEPQPQQPLPNPMKQMKEQLEMMRLLREAFGEPSRPVAPQIDPETAVLQALAKDTDIVERLANGAMGKLLGGKVDDGDPWAAVAMEAVKNGQAAELLRVGIESIFGGISGLFPKAAPPPNGTSPTVPSPPPSPVPSDAIAPTQSPEEQVLALTLDHCARRIPPQIACNRILAIADQINEQAPALSIDGYLSLFAEMTPDAALDLAKTLAPNGADVAALPHAAQWTAELQALLKTQLEGSADGDEDHA